MSRKPHHSLQPFTCPVCGKTAPGPLARGLVNPVVCTNHRGHKPRTVKQDAGSKVRVSPIVLMRPLPDEVRDILGNEAP